MKKSDWILLLCTLFVGVRANWLSDQKNDKGGESDSSSDESSEAFTPFSVITGRIRDSSDEQDRSPLRHHVDLEAMFPALGPDEDLMATSGEHYHNLWASHPPPRPSEAVEQDDENDDLVVPDFSNLYAQLPRIGENQLGDQQPWWQMLYPPQEWWKGSNVCIKREETEESSTSGGEAIPGQTSSSDMTRRRGGGVNREHAFHMQFSSCENLDTRYACTTRLYGPLIIKTISTVYECCNGYALDSAKSGCTRGHHKNIVETIEQLGGSEFLRLVRSVTGLEERLTGRGENLTIFMPNNDAVLRSSSNHFLPLSTSPHPRRLPRNILRHPNNVPAGRNVRRRPTDNNEMYPVPFDELGAAQEVTFDDDDLFVVKKLDSNMVLEPSEPETSLADTLLNHFVSGVLSTDDFVDEKVIYSEKSGGGGGENSARGGVLRLNTWSVGAETVRTVNCARLISSNNRCTNGMLHVVDKLITPVVQSIYDVLSTRSELSVWNSLVISSKEISALIRDKNQHLTLFAPTNAALDKVGPALMIKLRNGDSCLKRILSRHLVPITFCASIIHATGQVRTIEHDLLDVERAPGDKLFINGSQIIVRDIVTTNGVVHIIDAVLLSNNDKPMSEVLSEQEGFRSFSQEIRRLGLISEFDGCNNVTLFVPSDTAFAALSPEIRNNDEKLRNVLRYHVASPEIRACHFSHQELLPSALLTNVSSIRINLYSSFPLGSDVTTTASCAVLTRTNIVGCGGVAHSIDRVLSPTSLTLDIVASLKANSNFSIFSRLLSENEELFRTLRSKTSFHTLFVPSDAAFQALPQQQLALILNNRDEAARVLKRHITSDSLCCAGVPTRLYFVYKRVATLGEINVPVYRDPRGQVVFGNGLVTTCDLIASNGIIHTVDKVMVRPTLPTPEPDRSMSRSSPTTLGGRDSLDVELFFLRL